MNMWSALLDILFPPRPTERTVRAFVSRNTQLPRSPQHVAGVVALLSYHNVNVQAAVVENKFYRNEHAAKLLGTALAAWLETVPGPIVCIPIPLSAKRQKARGYNQVTEVLTHVSLPSVTILTKALVRNRDTVPQTSLARAERLKNMRDAFRIDEASIKALQTVTTVVIVDDVLTTGATLAAARAALAPHLPPTATLICVAFAH